jgi:UDP-2,3-diacylglucosamine pyrophosphatase LpxH
MPCFVSDAAHLLDADHVSLSIHGHTHDSFDHQVRGTASCATAWLCPCWHRREPDFDANIVAVEDLTMP